MFLNSNCICYYIYFNQITDDSITVSFSEVKRFKDQVKELQAKLLSLEKEKSCWESVQKELEEAKVQTLWNSDICCSCKYVYFNWLKRAMLNIVQRYFSSIFVFYFSCLEQSQYGICGRQHCVLFTTIYEKSTLY